MEFKKDDFVAFKGCSLGVVYAVGEGKIYVSDIWSGALFSIDPLDPECQDVHAVERGKALEKIREMKEECGDRISRINNLEYKDWVKEEGTKYAIAVPVDQTIVYFVEGDKDGDTISHEEATLFDDIRDAACVISRLSAEVAVRLAKAAIEKGEDLDESKIAKRSSMFFIEVVKDEAHFRAQSDTW